MQLVGKRYAFSFELEGNYNYRSNPLLLSLIASGGSKQSKHNVNVVQYVLSVPVFNYRAAAKQYI